MLCSLPPPYTRLRLPLLPKLTRTDSTPRAPRLQLLQNGPQTRLRRPLHPTEPPVLVCPPPRPARCRLFPRLRPQRRHKLTMTNIQTTHGLRLVPVPKIPTLRLPPRRVTPSHLWVMTPATPSPHLPTGPRTCDGSSPRTAHATRVFRRARIPLPPLQAHPLHLRPGAGWDTAGSPPTRAPNGA
jgi:hypothetical protein